MPRNVRENLKLTPDQRLRNLERLLRDAEEVRRAMEAAKTVVQDSGL